MDNEKSKIEAQPTIQVQQIVINAVEEYQCPGCVCGSDITCYEKSDNLACEKHCVGTLISGVGKIFLGMPKGFNRLGFMDKTKIYIFEKLTDGWGYDKFNIPVWKYLNEHNNTVVRGICPRTNYAWIHIFLENCIDKIECLEITKNDIDEMD